MTVVIRPTSTVKVLRAADGTVKVLRTLIAGPKGDGGDPGPSVLATLVNTIGVIDAPVEYGDTFSPGAAPFVLMVQNPDQFDLPGTWKLVKLGIGSFPTNLDSTLTTLNTITAVDPPAGVVDNSIGLLVQQRVFGGVGGTPTIRELKPTFADVGKVVTVVDDTFGHGSIGFVAPTAPAWGAITGTLSNQTDLQAALDLKAPLASPTLTGVPLAPTAAFGTNTTQLSTTAFVQAAVSAAVAGLLELKGSTDCSANPNYPAGLVGDTYYVTVAGKIGGAAGKSVDVGDAYVCKADNAGGTEASVGTSWFVLEHNLAGALLSANNLSDLANAGTARTNLGLGTLATLSAAPAGTLTGTALNATVVSSSLTSVGVLTGGSTGAGFTVALDSATITGTLADARLSANVPLKNAANTFTLANTFSTSVLTNLITSNGAVDLVIKPATGASSQSVAFQTQSGLETFRSTGSGNPRVQVAYVNTYGEEPTNAAFQAYCRSSTAVPFSANNWLGQTADTLTMTGVTSTSVRRQQGAVNSAWNANDGTAGTDATRSGDLILCAYTVTTKQEGIRISAAAGGLKMGFFAATPVAKPTVTGSRGGNAALASLLTALANLGLITDSSS